MVGQVIRGLGSIASGMIGSGRRKKEQRAAQAEMNMLKQRYENQDTSNVYSNMENTMEDLTVNQDQAMFQTEQANQGLSNIMDSMQGAAGGSGIASLAQSLANQQQNQVRQASLDIGRQEQTNQRAERQQAANLQLYDAKGELLSRDAKNEINSTLLGMSQQRLAGANADRKRATNAIVGGVGQVAGAAASVVGGLPSMQDTPIGGMLS